MRRAAFAMAFLAGVGGLAYSGGAEAATPIPAFSGSASAEGAALNITVPGAALSDQVADLTGPTAQVAVNTIGSSTGFAALPDPGDVLIGLPGFATGLLSLGVLGLPPIHVPKLPSYPLFISSNAQNHPNATEGAGPYALEAHSTPTSSTALATGGLETGILGNAVSLRSNASLKATPSSVVSTATSIMQGVVVGPLSIGEIRSTATETRTSDGTVTPTTDLSISGASIGGIAVELTPDGLNAVGQKVSLGLNKTLNTLLATAKLHVTVEPAKTFKHRVISPALVISMPIPKRLGIATGKLQITAGQANAALLASPSGVGPLTPPTSGPPSTAPGPGPGTTTGGGSTTPITTGGSGLSGGSTGGALPGIDTTGTGGGSTTPTVAGDAPTSAINTTTVAFNRQFDIRSLYLLLALVGAILLGTAPLQRLLGVRRRWTSGD